MNDQSFGTSTHVSLELREAIETIEEAYEFMLAYAAQGRAQEEEAEGSSQVRSYLGRFREALDVVGNHTPALISYTGTGSAFASHIERDTEVMKSVIDLLTQGQSISSDMIDNTNGMIAVRSFLTDLFFIDQVLLPKRS